MSKSSMVASSIPKSSIYHGNKDASSQLWHSIPRNDSFMGHFPATTIVEGGVDWPCKRSGNLSMIGEKGRIEVELMHNGRRCIDVTNRI